ncbi:hypothetical protein, variant [Microbotryum lychnidis-dioicae p1A1 Lamole]|uniref:Amidase domain-containing protein n=1 Tax=Microbotryum lychnidis-dioicae (strain p1A1 Lamole / MvSl-1064) TaxID=683840 RepID=U5HF75_USTV1|nr:hypothetical protein, variant [Microbotryum lychnidis-dioicae p1A1 Lamole]|eukprot:KDE03753.1 hypothetical protein, variant [Microbotryum lychnidis-dioicae p1A1 Lamole]
MIAAGSAAWRPGKASPSFATHRRSLDTWKTLRRSRESTKTLSPTANTGSTFRLLLLCSACRIFAIAKLSLASATAVSRSSTTASTACNTVEPSRGAIGVSSGLKPSTTSNGVFPVDLFRLELITNSTVAMWLAQSFCRRLASVRRTWITVLFVRSLRPLVCGWNAVDIASLGFMSHGFVSALFVGSHREAVPFALVSARARSRAKCNAIPSVAKLFVKAVVEAEPWRVDPYVTYRPWQNELYQLKDYAGGNKLGLGLWRDDGHCRPAAPYARALYKTKKALEAEGHTVIDWSFDDALDGLKILVDLYAADGEKGFDIACAESGESRILEG